MPRGPVEGPPADAEVAHRDSVRAVTEALWALPEPYQSTLVQRYFEELQPSRIAARSGVPLATVKSRLQRGLELLRQTLERRDGRSWRTAIGPAFGLPVTGSWFLPVLSVTSMSTLAKSSALLAACVLAAFTLWAVVPEAVEPPPPVAADAAVPARASLAVGDAKSPATRAMVPAPAGAAADLAQPYEFELRARVVDADGLALGGGHLALAPPGCALALSDPMDGYGRVTVRWRARAKVLTMAVGFAFQGDHTSLQQVLRSQPE